jgi:hypothetical protein
MNPASSATSTSSNAGTRFPNPNIFKPTKNLDQEWMEFTSQMIQGRIFNFFCNIF